MYIYNTHAVAHTQVTHMCMHTHTHRISNWKREEGEEENSNSHHCITIILRPPSKHPLCLFFLGRTSGGPESFCNLRKRRSGLSAPKWPAGSRLSQGQAVFKKPHLHNSHFDSKDSACSWCARSCGNTVTLHDLAAQSPGSYMGTTSP